MVGWDSGAAVMSGGREMDERHHGEAIQRENHQEVSIRTEKRSVTCGNNSC
jgi:hypothetical protein